MGDNSQLSRSTAGFPFGKPFWGSLARQGILAKAPTALPFSSYHRVLSLLLDHQPPHQVVAYLRSSSTSDQQITVCPLSWDVSHSTSHQMLLPSSLAAIRCLSKHSFGVDVNSSSVPGILLLNTNKILLQLLKEKDSPKINMRLVLQKWRPWGHIPVPHQFILDYLDVIHL
jgi:hypothetical protein